MKENRIFQRFIMAMVVLVSVSVYAENESLPFVSPIFGDHMVLQRGELIGFEVAGADGVFVPAQAKIDGETVVVSSDEVKAPAAVRYGWANVPDANLFNKNNLPASPFTTASAR
jgi:hypothetical protein